MGYKWHSTGTKGLRYREHPTRKHGVGKKDRYYAIRYQKDGKRVEEGLGWASDEGFDLDKSLEELSALRRAARTGEGPTRLKEKRDLAAEQRKADQKAKREAAAKEVSFKAFAEDQYFPIADAGWKPETARKHKEHCSNWLYPHLGDIPLRDITLAQVNKVKAALMIKKRAPRTMQAVFRTLAMIWTAARDAEIVTAKCPTQKTSFKLPKIDNESMAHLTIEECNILLEKVRARSEQAADMAFVALESGLRFGEIAVLTWASVDLENKSLRVMNTKGKKDRIVPMTPDLYEWLNSRKQGHANEFLFPNKYGKKHSQVPTPFKKGLEDSELNEDVEDRKMKVSFHTLRHTYASRMVQNGVDLYKLQRILGHSTPALTARYAKFADGDLKTAVERAVTREKMKASKNGGKLISMNGTTNK